jgi:hypothetical protein
MYWQYYSPIAAVCLMQRPDLHIVKPAPDVDPDPPRGEITAEEQVLEPVPDSEVSKPITNTLLSWLRRSLAVASVLAIITLIFLGMLSAVFIVVDSPAPRADVPTTEPPPDLAQTDETLNFHSFSEANLAPVTTGRSNVRRRRLRPRIRANGYKSRRPNRPPHRLRKPLVPLFMPTTLVIYIEDGVIKTRIEPWHQTTPSLKGRQ